MKQIESFGDWVRRQRKALDLTQVELAQCVGCVPGTIKRIEADERRPSRQMADRLATCLHIPYEERPAFVKAARTQLGAGQWPQTARLPESPAARTESPRLPVPPDRPHGTLAFLFTDIEGSTVLWERHALAMPDVITRHHTLLRSVIEAHSGTVFKTVGDGVYASFAAITDGVAAAVAAQRALRNEAWGIPDSLRVRMALHVGTVEIYDDDYSGPSLNRIARILSAGHGGQVLLSLTAQELFRDLLPPAVGLRDLGIHLLKDLIRPEHLFQIVTPDLPANFPPLKTLDAHPTNLPIQPTSLIGREREVATVCAMLGRSDVRLLTLTGSAGSGKTRLGLQVAAELVDAYVDGVFFIGLASVRDPDLVLSAIAQPLGVKEYGGQSLYETLGQYLRTKQLLLVLDNFEHVLAAASVVADLLIICPHLKVLITSREALHLRGEQEFQVPPLVLPDPSRLPSIERLTQYEGVRLFIERAQAVKPDFQVTNATAPAVAEICARLDGLPLAIELAAGRIKLFPPSALLARLNHRLELLTSGPRDLPLRQQTLRNTINWSYDLLNDGEQVLFARLAVFVGGSTLEAVEEVCNTNTIDNQALMVLDDLSSLVDKSLVHQHDGPSGEPRYTMLSTIWEYALERLEGGGEAEALRQQHAQYYLVLAEAAATRLLGSQQDPWLGQLNVDHDNLRTALSWALAHSEAEIAVRLGAALWRFWEIHGHFAEGRRWLEAVVSAGNGDPTVARADVFTGLGTFAWHQGQYEQANTFHHEALALYRTLGDTSGATFALNNLGAQALVQGDLDQAELYFRESLRVCQETDNQQIGVYVFHNLGDVARYRGDYIRAVAQYTQSLALSREQGNQWAIALNAKALGVVADLQGNDEQAVSYYTESLDLCRKIGDKECTAECLEGLGRVAARTQHLARAAKLLGAAASLRDTVGVPVPPVQVAGYDRTIAAIRASLETNIFVTAWAQGQAMTLNQMITYGCQKSQ